MCTDIHFPLKMSSTACALPLGMAHYLYGNLWGVGEPVIGAGMVFGSGILGRYGSLNQNARQTHHLSNAPQFTLINQDILFWSKGVRRPRQNPS